VGPLTLDSPESSADLLGERDEDALWPRARVDQQSRTRMRSPDHHPRPEHPTMTSQVCVGLPCPKNSLGPLDRDQ
jgi:hypothetical protein